MTSLPAYVRADVIGSIAAQHLKPRDLDDLAGQLAVLLGWTYPGGYPRTAVVRARINHNGRMRRHLAFRILGLVGATDQEYHDMIHRLTCGELGAEDMAYINRKG